jgi:hypothetical protein
MLRTKVGAGIAVAATLAFGTGPALAASGWTIVSMPPAGQNAPIRAVSTVSGTDAWAVGWHSGNAGTNVGAKALIDNWNGTAWSASSVPTTPGNTALLYAVSGSSATDAWAVGRTQVNKSALEPLALHWNGTAWSVSSGFSAAFSDIAGGTAEGVADISPTDAYAIGYSAATASGALAQWNGTAWSAVPLPLPANANSDTTLNAISANGPDDVWIVGTFLDSVTHQNETFSEHFNGTAWSVVSMPLVSSTNINAFYLFNGIQANSPTDVWAVGESSVVDSTTSTDLIEHWNGTVWSIVPSPSPGTGDSLTGVTTSNAANDVWAVGVTQPAGATQGQTLTLNWNGTTWTTVASPDAGSPSVLNSVSTNPGGAIVWAAGESGISGSFNPLAMETPG